MSHVTPLVDLVFKKLFGVEENKDLLMSLINAVVSDEDQVESITILNPYNALSFRNDKLSILDVKAEGHNGKRFNIEIQMASQAHYAKRALYYWGKLYTEQLETGHAYHDLNKAIGIHILNFDSVIESEKYHNIFHITEKETNVHYFKDLELHTIELKKFDRDIDNDFSKLMEKMKSKVDIWCAFLTKHDLLERKKTEIPTNPEYQSLKKALDVIEVMNFGSDEREVYEGRLKWIRDEQSVFEQKYMDGLKTGREEGREEGIEKGREEEKNTIAKNMIQQGMELDQISKITKIPVEQLQLLKNE